MSKTKQNKHQPTSSCLLSPLQEGAGVQRAAAALLTPASSQGSHTPVRGSRLEAQPTFQGRSALWEHAASVFLAATGHRPCNRLPARGQLPEDNACRDQWGFETLVTLRTFIPREFTLILRDHFLTGTQNGPSVFPAPHDRHRTS